MFVVVVVVVVIIIRDVNETQKSGVSIFFLDPGKGISRLPRIETSDRPTIGPIVSRIIVTGCSAVAINRSLVCFTRPWPAYQTHGCGETKDSGVSKS